MLIPISEKCNFILFVLLSGSQFWSRGRCQRRDQRKTIAPAAANVRRGRCPTSSPDTSNLKGYNHFIFNDSRRSSPILISFPSSSFRRSPPPSGPRQTSTTRRPPTSRRTGRGPAGRTSPRSAARDSSSLWRAADSSAGQSWLGCFASWVAKFNPVITWWRIMTGFSISLSVMRASPTSSACSGPVSRTSPRPSRRSTASPDTPSRSTGRIRRLRGARGGPPRTYSPSRKDPIEDTRIRQRFIFPIPYEITSECFDWIYLVAVP